MERDWEECGWRGMGKGVSGEEWRGVWVEIRGGVERDRGMGEQLWDGWRLLMLGCECEGMCEGCGMFSRSLPHPPSRH